jgi:hypothetical protein
MKYIDREKLKIKKKPKDFSFFESKEDLLKEDADTEFAHLYKETRDYFIVKESKSAKDPNKKKRKKRRKIISMIKAGKIK